MNFLDRLRFHSSVIPDRTAAQDESRRLPPEAVDVLRESLVHADPTPIAEACDLPSVPDIPLRNRNVLDQLAPGSREDRDPLVRAVEGGFSPWPATISAPVKARSD